MLFLSSKGQLQPSYSSSLILVTRVSLWIPPPASLPATPHPLRPYNYKVGLYIDVDWSERPFSSITGSGAPPIHFGPLKFALGTFVPWKDQQ